jgi:transcriptional regulator with XRE-family HTH domain
LNTFDRIDLLLKQKNLKQIDLTNYLGIPKTSYTDWKSGRTKSYQKYLSQIAAFFNVSADYLVDPPIKR